MKNSDVKVFWQKIISIESSHLQTAQWSRANIQVCDLFAVQGGTILAARFPAWPVPHRFNTLETPTYVEVPMVTPHSNEAYPRHVAQDFDNPWNEFNQPLSPLRSQKAATPPDKRYGMQSCNCRFSLHKQGCVGLSDHKFKQWFSWRYSPLCMWLSIPSRPFG